jgi:hypothetical protein
VREALVALAATSGWSLRASHAARGRRWQPRSVLRDGVYTRTLRLRLRYARIGWRCYVALHSTGSVDAAARPG